MLRAWGLERTGPAAVGFDDFVDLGHQADGFAEGDDECHHSPAPTKSFYPSPCPACGSSSHFPPDSSGGRKPSF